MKNKHHLDNFLYRRISTNQSLSSVYCPMLKVSSNVGTNVSNTCACVGLCVYFFFCSKEIKCIRELQVPRL